MNTAMRDPTYTSDLVRIAAEKGRRRNLASKADPSMAVLKRGMYPRVLEALATKLKV